jgi:hypothetical protein
VTLEDCDHEVVLRPKVPVQRGLRDPGLGDDPIDSDSGEAFLYEELIGGAENALASVEARLLRWIAGGKPGARSPDIGAFGDRWIVQTCLSSAIFFSIWIQTGL